MYDHYYSQVELTAIHMSQQNQSGITDEMIAVKVFRLSIQNSVCIFMYDKCKLLVQTVKSPS
jgi:hypothetical protein